MKDIPSVRATFVFPNEAAANDLTMEFGGNTFPSSVSPLVDVLGMKHKSCFGYVYFDESI